MSKNIRGVILADCTATENLKNTGNENSQRARKDRGKDNSQQNRGPTRTYLDDMIAVSFKDHPALGIHMERLQIEFKIGNKLSAKF
jgi:hypothetical protein